jgi:exosortase
MNYSSNYVYWGFLVSAFTFCFARAFMSLVSVWTDSYIYSYGYLIPIISLYLIWQERDRLKKIRSEPSFFPGFTIFVVGLIILIAGHTSRVVSLQGISSVVSLIGIALLLLGWRYLSVLLFPLLYLLFMVPFWDRLTEHLHVPFQNFSAMIGTSLLQLVGIPAYRSTIYIELPNITLEVARVCSGVNNLIAVAAIAIPLAYITLHSWTRRLILFFSGIAIAIFGNCLRVALIGVLAYYKMAGDLHGPYHILQGLTVSYVGFAALFVCAWILSRGQPKDSKDNFSEIISYPQPPAKSSVNYYLTVSALLIFVGFYLNVLSKS